MDCKTKTCPQCDVGATGFDEIDRIFGHRTASVCAQSWCKICRAMPPIKKASAERIRKAFKVCTQCNKSKKQGAKFRTIRRNGIERLHPWCRDCERAKARKSA